TSRITRKLNPARLGLAALLGLSSSAALAADSITLEYGVGNKTAVTRVAAQWNWDKTLMKTADGVVVGHWDLSASHWHGSRFNNTPGLSQSFYTLGITPVIRWQGNGATGPYAEAGLG